MSQRSSARNFAKEEFSGFLGSVQHHFERMKDDPKTVAASSDLAKASSKSKSQKKAGKKIRMLFRKLDTDQSGTISEEEFFHGIEEHQLEVAVSEERVDAVLRQVCGDGAVSMDIDQFQRALKLLQEEEEEFTSI